MLGAATDCGNMPAAQGLDAPTEAAEQVPPTGDLNGVQDTLANATGVGAGTNASDDVDVWPLAS